MYVFGQVLLLWKLRLGLKPVLLNREGRCPLLLRQGIFVVRCSRIQQLGSLLLMLPAYWRGEWWWPDQGWTFLQPPLCSDTDSGDMDWQVPRQPVSSCQCAAFLQWRRGSLEKRVARKLNQLISSLLCAVLSCSPAWCYHSSARFCSVRPNKNTSWKRPFEPRLWLPSLADSCMTDVHKALQSTCSICW